MSIEAVILDIESQFESRLDMEKRLLRQELVDAELAQIEINSRLTASRNKKVDVFLSDGRVITLMIVRVGIDWVLGRVEEWEYLIPLKAIGAIRYLSRATQPLTDLEKRVTLQSVIRELARRRNQIRWVCQLGEWRGEILATGRDWVDLRDADSAKIVTLACGDLVSITTLHRLGR